MRGAILFIHLFMYLFDTCSLLMLIVFTSVCATNWPSGIIKITLRMTLAQILSTFTHLPFIIINLYLKKMPSCHQYYGWCFIFENFPRFIGMIYLIYLSKLSLYTDPKLIRYFSDKACLVVILGRTIFNIWRHFSVQFVFYSLWH